MVTLADEANILGFLSECTSIEKTGQIPGRLVGKMIAGGLGGGALGYATGEDLPREARIRRAMGGGLLGLLGGGAVHAASPGGARELADVAKREIYGLFGRIPKQTPEELLRLRLGTAGRALALQEAAGAGAPTARARARLEAARAGVDTLSGLLRGLVSRPGETLGLSWRATPATRKALLGLGGLRAAKAVMVRSELEDTYGEEAGKEIGRAAGLLASGSLPIVPAMVLSSGGSGLGGLLGRQLI